MDWQQYIADPRMNASTLVHGFKSLRSLKRAIDGGAIEETAAMRFGQQYHSLILEPDEFNRTHVVMPNFAKSEHNVDKDGKRSTSGNTKWCKHAKAEFCRQHAGKSIIDQEKFDNALSMIESINSKVKARQLIEESNKEITVTGRIAHTDCKGRLDLISRQAITDIKGTNSVAPSLFGELACRLHYPEKMAFYRELVRQRTGQILPVYLIAVETAGDFDCAVFELPEILLDHAIGKVSRLMLEYENAVRFDQWPGVDRGEEVLQFHVPNWYMPEDGDGLDWGDAA